MGGATEHVLQCVFAYFVECSLPWISRHRHCENVAYHLAYKTNFVNDGSP
jgi:hypothetical protein